MSFRKVGIQARFVDGSDLDQWKAAVTPKTKAFYAEMIGNPTIDVIDIEQLAALAHEIGVPLIVDNTFASPYLCRPLEWGPTSWSTRRPSSSVVTARRSAA